MTSQTPVAKFFSPFLALIFLGVLSGIFLLLVAGMPDCLLKGFRVAFGGVAGFLTLWTLTSLLPALGSLLFFMDLMEEAAQVKDIT